MTTACVIHRPSNNRRASGFEYKVRARLTLDRVRSNKVQIRGQLGTLMNKVYTKFLLHYSMGNQFSCSAPRFFQTQGAYED